MTKDELFHFLDELSLGVIASISQLQQPQAALVGFAVTPDLELIFDTLKSSRKYENLIANPQIAFVAGWEDERTVQYEGEAEELHGERPQHFKEIYFRKLPECRAHESWTGIVHFLVTPKWIRYRDYTLGSEQLKEFEFTFPGTASSLNVVPAE